MCTALLRMDRAAGAEWPLLLAFVRDEDRSRAWDLPSRWWAPEHSYVGGRDTRAGGTWLAVDDDAGSPAVAFLLNRLDVGAGRRRVDEPVTRGTLPLHALAHRADPFGAVPLERYEPFDLVRADPSLADEWRWDGAELEHAPLADGWHMFGSRGPAAPEAAERLDLWIPQASGLPEPDLAQLGSGSTADVWGDWLELLDGRAAQIGDLTSLVLAGVPEHPQFGTVAGTLVAIHVSGRVRVDSNATQMLDPDAWQHVAPD